MQYGVEVGYDIGVSPELVIRPKAGIGMGSAKAEVSGGGFDDSQSESGLFIPIGAALLYSMGGWFIGGDVRYAIFGVTNETTVAGASVENDVDVSGLLFGIGAGAAF